MLPEINVSNDGTALTLTEIDGEASGCAPLIPTWYFPEQAGGRDLIQMPLIWKL